MTISSTMLPQQYHCYDPFLYALIGIFILGILILATRRWILDKIKTKLILKREKKSILHQLPHHDTQMCVRIFEKVGEGSSAEVFWGTWGSRDVAIKILKNDWDDSWKELDMLQSFTECPEILKLIGIVHTPSTTMIALEYAPNGTVEELLVKSHKHVSHRLVMRLMYDACMGLCTIHSKNYVHGDMAARNVLISADWHAKIADFGLGRKLEQNEEMQHTETDPGPIRWLPPETLLHNTYSIHTDEYAFGVTMYEMLNRKIPWQGHPAPDIIMNVTNGVKLTISKNVNAILTEIMNKCWETNPKDRYSMVQIQKSLKNYILNL